MISSGRKLFLKWRITGGLPRLVCGQNLARALANPTDLLASATTGKYTVSSPLAALLATACLGVNELALARDFLTSPHCNLEGHPSAQELSLNPLTLAHQRPSSPSISLQPGKLSAPGVLGTKEMP